MKTFYHCMQKQVKGGNMFKPKRLNEPNKPEKQNKEA